ncbi:MAPEG family protein [Sinimarinibacterium sp. CAU 1509]|uniref:MAPEG family protein n=1 Tax=Sinimarinibacterium sp. CAU 1509 TaxID=2562283 RepID=UPI0010ABA002|nr:MAPEG family protein [Sinimarinibacterium sp. CAU 1509]TJY55545.1 MAPEG family protein [Sinimarinibacterium sp. CAU 1509]
MQAAHPMLAPAIALVLWTFVIWLWMYATRIPAIQKARMVLDPYRVKGEQMAELPPQVRWKADNYNHLMEQPTLFYAVVLLLALIGDASTASLALAWTYVGLRVVHSLVQTLINKIEVRFVVFAVSSLVLLALAVRAALQLC